MPATSSNAGPLRPAQQPQISLRDLRLGVLSSDEGVQIRGMTMDSRFVRPGDLYVALPGTRTHGARFAAAAIEAGAVAVLTDHAGRELLPPLPVPVVVTADPRVTMAAVAAQVFGYPTAGLVTYGITGTNGKTTTMAIVEAALRAAGTHTGTIGTMGFQLDGQKLGGTRTTVTTPESVDLQALFAVFAESGAEHVAMEVSSHALALHRVDHVQFDVVGFTNLGRDHLDFHHTLEEYFSAKARLFRGGFSQHAVITTDDDAGRRLVAIAQAAGVRVATASTVDPSADYFVAADGRPDGGWQLHLRTPTGTYDTPFALPGRHNVANAVLAAGLVETAGVRLADCLQGFAGVQVPGRMQRVQLSEPAPAVYVDFAHTPQAVAATLGAFTERTGRLIAVLGCGGDRDRAKREPMGRAAADLADVVVVTDDNPRTESPSAIRAQVLAGARQGPAQVHDGGPRGAAIRQALQLAGPTDIVAVLGKGHEQGQEINGEMVPFDDVTEVTTAWQETR